MKKIKFLFLLLSLTQFSCINEDDIISPSNDSFLNENETYFDNKITYPTIINLNISELKNFKCFFNIKNKPVKFKIYSNDTLIYDSGYNGTKTYQSILDSYLTDNGYSTEAISDFFYIPFPMNSYYWEVIFEIPPHPIISVYVYNPLGSEWSFMWESIANHQ